MSVLNKSKFKVGDKVKIIGRSYCHHFAIGSIGTISKVERRDGDYTVSGIYTGDHWAVNTPGTQIIHKSALKLVNKNAVNWLKALRSGKFIKASGQLRKNGAYCCLGVACELYRKARKRGNIRWQGETTFTVGEQDSNELFLPEPVRTWLGLTSIGGGGLKNFRGIPAYSLVNVNDNWQNSFAEIADIIEQNASTLFVPGKQEVK